jgi:hypothetical protein
MHYSPTLPRRNGILGSPQIGPVQHRRPSQARRAAGVVVAQDVRRIVMGKVNDTARRLLREMGYQVEGSPTPDVVPRKAALNLGIDPEAPEYEAALNHLLALSDIEPNRRQREHARRAAYAAARKQLRLRSASIEY